jgi:hypothetical protein
LDTDLVGEWLGVPDRYSVTPTLGAGLTGQLCTGAILVNYR